MCAIAQEPQLFPSTHISAKLISKWILLSAGNYRHLLRCMCANVCEKLSPSKPKMEVAWSSEMLVGIYQTSRCQTSEILKFFFTLCHQSRVVTGLLTGHNTLRRHLYLLRLIDSPSCRACVVKEETSAHILCECEALAPLRHTYLGSFFLEPEDNKSMSLGAVCSYGRAIRLLWFWYGAQRARLKCLGASGPRGPVPTCNSIQFNTLSLHGHNWNVIYTLWGLCWSRKHQES